MLIQRLKSAVIFTSALFVVSLFVVGSSLAVAQKGKGGGKDGGDSEVGQNGGGMIYFRKSNGTNASPTLFSMRDDGSGLTGYPEADFNAGYGHPSYQRHGGERWFARSEDTQSINLYSESGDAAIVTLPQDFESLGSVHWANDDLWITFLARRWDVDPESMTFGEVLEGGIYSVNYAESAEGHIQSSEETPLLLFHSELVVDSEGVLRPDMNSFSFAPDNIQFVFSRHSVRRLDIGESFSDRYRFLYADPDGYGCDQLEWSPQGNKIAFAVYSTHWKLMVVDVDGTNGFVLAQAGVNWRPYLPKWSPTGSHLVYSHVHNLYRDTYLIRASADGSNLTRLTDKDFNSGAGLFPNGWRADD